MTDFPQYVGLSASSPATKAILALAVSTFGTGSGYVGGDVGKTVTLSGGTFTTQTTATIASVSSGKITALTMTDAGLYTELPNSESGSCSIVGSGTTGTGGTVTYGPYVLLLPSAASFGASGFGSSYSGITVSAWLSPDCGEFTLVAIHPLNSLSSGITFKFQYLGTSLTVTGFDSSDVLIFSVRYDDVDLTHAPAHFLCSCNTATQTALFYVNDVAQTAASTTWANTHAIHNPANTIWFFSQFSATGVYNAWFDPSFTDLTIAGNRRVFINSDLTPVDPATTLPTAAANFYVLPGDSPDDFFTNHGTGGAWTEYGTALWSKGECIPFLSASSYSFSTDFNTPISDVLTQFPATLVAPAGTYRPGATITFTKTSDPTLGNSATIDSDGTFTYTPAADYYGDDSFQYTVTETMPSPYEAPGYSATSTIQINVASPPPPPPTFPPLDEWTITSKFSTPSEGGIGDLWMDEQYIDFSDTPTRRKFINSDKSWISLGEFGELPLPADTYPLVWNTIPDGGIPSDFIYGYGQNGNANGWGEISTGNDPTTDLPYPQMAFDICPVADSRQTVMILAM